METANETTLEEPDSASSFTLTGSINSGLAELSWTTVTGASDYILVRLPVPATGYDYEELEPVGSTLVDNVSVVAVASGLCQVRYRVQALDSNEEIIASSNSVDFITTPDSEVFPNGECREPI
tara:strand:+ start:212 stop:580 length:369 start_codon:yes stop_codon:yes gene_type:complete